MDQELNYLYGLEVFGIKLGLGEITKLLGVLGNPQLDFKSIHIAGTNGKGSTACFIYNILKEAGYKTGLYTSPHLVKFNERILIDGLEISDETLIGLVHFIRKKVEEHKLHPTFFEFTTALMFLYFSRQKIDFAVIETGMGGRLDATNVLEPIMSVLTPIALDHIKYLGADKYTIAKEKAAIIKKPGLVVTSEEDPKILDLFKEKTPSLFVLDQEVKYKLEKSDLDTQTFSVQRRFNTSFEIKMLGEYQIKNALTAAIAADLLKIPLDIIKKGLKKTKWPGRLELVQKEPSILLDGAHNLAAFEKLRDFILKLKNKKVLVLGVAEDKDIEKMVSLLVPLFESIILTQANFKPASLEALEKEVKKYNQNIFKITNPAKAVKKAIELSEEKDLILVTGSLYLIGDVKSQTNF